MKELVAIITTILENGEEAVMTETIPATEEGRKELVEGYLTEEEYYPEEKEEFITGETIAIAGENIRIEVVEEKEYEETKENKQKTIPEGRFIVEIVKYEDLGEVEFPLFAIEGTKEEKEEIIEKYIYEYGERVEQEDKERFITGELTRITTEYTEIKVIPHEEY